MTTAGRGDRLPPSERMVAFTDAAVAIALTLLVLPLVDLVPEAAQSGEPASEVVTDHLAAIGSFLLSFVVIARFWSVHHRLFAYANRLTHPLVSLNLLWVLSIAVLPFPTEMVASFDGDDHFVVPFYLAVLLVCSASMSAMTAMLRGTAVRDGDDDGVPEEFVVGSWASTCTIVVALVLALVLPLGPWVFFVLLADPIFSPAIRRVRRRGH